MAAQIFKKLNGTISSWFQLGIGAASHGIKDQTLGVQACLVNGGSQSNFLSAQHDGSATVVAADSVVPNFLDLQQRDCVIAQGFDGTTGPVGATVGDYMICHTTGGAYTAGHIYIADTAISGIAIPMYKMQSVCNRVAFSGTVSMISNGFYTATTGSAPFGWTLFGDGTTGAAGEVRLITVPFGFADFTFPTDATKDSTTAIASGAIVTKASVKINTAFMIVAVPFDGQIKASVLGTPTSILAYTDSNLAYGAGNQFDSDFDVPISAGGVVRLTLHCLTAVPTVGAGVVNVEYCNTPLA